MVVRGFAQAKSAFDEADELSRQVDLIAAQGVPPREIQRYISDGRLDEQVNLLVALDGMTSGDTFVLARLDSLSSNCEWGLRMIRELHRQGINLAVLEQGIDDTPLGLERLQTLLAVADWEYADKADRIRGGMSTARDNGVALGRPKKLDDRMRRYFFDLLQAGNSKSAVERTFSISRRTLARIEREFSDA